MSEGIPAAGAGRGRPPQSYNFAKSALASLAMPMMSI
jgi:hypothetical protein